jgi:hypothetical protein
MSVRRISRILLMLCVCSFGIAWAQPQHKGMGGKKGARRAQRIDALERMTPEQQERFLNTLPPRRRAEAQRLLGNWRDMSPQERARARRSLGEFRGLPPDRQRRIRMLFVQFNELPAERRPIVRAELAELRRLDPAEIRTRVESEEFRIKYSPVERRLLSDLSAALPRQDEEEPQD